MRVFVKDPSARIDYMIDWGAGHLGNNIINASTWSVTPEHDNGISVVEFSHDGRKSTASIEGGVAGKIYDVRNHIILNNGESDDRSISFRVEKR